MYFTLTTRISDQRSNERTPTMLALGRRDPVLRLEALPQRVEWAGSDVAVDDAECREGEQTEALPRRRGVMHLVIELCD